MRARPLLLMVLVLVGLSLPSFASTISFDLSVPNSDLSTYSGPYATVSITVTSGVATFDITAKPNYRLGDGSTFAFNTASSVTISNLTTTGGNGEWAGTYGGKSYPKYDSGNVSDFGYFTNTIKGHGGDPEAVDSLHFTISGTYTDAYSVLVNNGGYVAAGHVFVYDSTGANKKTGYAGNGPLPSPTPPVPELSSLALFGSGLVTFGSFARRRFFKG